MSMSMLTSFDPFFRDFDRIADGRLGRRAQSPRLMRADAFRRGEEFVVNFDLPGVDPASVEVTVEKNVLSVAAERRWTPQEGDRVVLAERPQGRYGRKLYLSDNVNADAIEARYDDGVLSLRIPVSEAAKPRKVEITSGDGQEAVLAGASSES
jgi:HSP20 family protein